MSENNKEENDEDEDKELPSTGAFRDARKKRVSVEDINIKEDK
jgi:hypothetical protein